MLITHLFCCAFYQTVMRLCSCMSLPTYTMKSPFYQFHSQILQNSFFSAPLNEIFLSRSIEKWGKMWWKINIIPISPHSHFFRWFFRMVAVPILFLLFFILSNLPFTPKCTRKGKGKKSALNKSKPNSCEKTIFSQFFYLLFSIDVPVNTKKTICK